MIKLARLCAKTRLEVAKAFAVSELREGHGQVLIETGERFDSVFRTVMPYAATKRRQRRSSNRDQKKHELSFPLNSVADNQSIKVGTLVTLSIFSIYLLQLELQAISIHQAPNETSCAMPHQQSSPLENHGD